MLKIAMAGVWHVHAEGYANEINASSSAKVCAVWDSDKERGKGFAEKFGCDFFESYDDMLSSDIDAVAVTAATNIHKDILVKAAKAKKDIFTEKVLALTNEEADEISKAVKESGVKFVISYAHMRNDAVLTAKEICDSGKLGTLTYARMRNTHSGSVDNWLPEHFYSKEQCGGGAMIDLGAHPMYILNWILGKPESVCSVFTNVTDRPVEDNAVSVLRFKNGAIGVSETGFVSRKDKCIIEVSGTNGYLRVTGNEVWCSSCEGSGEFEKIEVKSHGALSPLSYWLGLLDGKEDKHLYTIDDAVVLTQIMQAAYLSDKTRTEIKL